MVDTQVKGADRRLNESWTKRARWANKAQTDFSRSFLRSEPFLPQNHAILRNVLQAIIVRNTREVPLCATPRK
ncbi:MAG: hypothetical protein DMF03_12450 [Verrucomicrobia bacterium]|nr:MAG: hypothetical protein DMF03_12450 [Verrucomicrobiota bacterium]